ncbi:MAG: glutamine-hydrolyzing GMP synthase, partial [Ghiorsea sp.]|nr:glutamine-hydrolyzing GMP synthase [Ghiorsea sp.]
MSDSKDKILILDFGSQYTQLIARRVREAEVFSEIHPWDMDEAAIKAFQPSGIILSGGPNSVNDEETFEAPACVFEMGVPVLGICFGMQTMAAQLGGTVEEGLTREFGYAELVTSSDSVRLRGIEDKEDGLLDVWMSHGDKVIALPEGFK